MKKQEIIAISIIAILICSIIYPMWALKIAAQLLVFAMEIGMMAIVVRAVVKIAKI